MLGRGGTGVVYRAHDRTSGRMVALKLARGTSRSRLASEFDVWSRLKHPGIVRAYEFAVVRRGPFPAGTPYLVLEHVPLGVPGRPELRPGRMQPAQLEALALQMLGALGHVHEAGWVHRDLKPANLLASIGTGRWPRFKLTDFGLATRIGASSPLGTFSGSLAYVAPEALLGQMAVISPGVDSVSMVGLTLIVKIYQRSISNKRILAGVLNPDTIFGKHKDGIVGETQFVKPRIYCIQYKPADAD